ncbi:cystatin-A-like [Branchiostoma lanceolatum]|uniref:cystatin-A-like n=1 Tax=Branchiostoma lanceolatum TaxID=7740 RepID=UPI003451FEA0
MSGSNTGGWTEPKNITTDYNEAQALVSCFLLKPQVEERMNDGKSFQTYKPFSYQYQLVNGYNYKILVDVGGGTLQVEVSCDFDLVPPKLTGTVWVTKK